MEHINFESLSKTHRIFFILSFFAFLAIFSSIWRIILAEETPSTPSNLNYGTVTSSSIPLYWTDNSDNEDKFNIERKLTTATDWSGAWSNQINTVNTTTYTDTSVTVGNTYDYRIQACLSGTGCSEWNYRIGVIVPTGGGTYCTTLNLNLNDGKTTYTIGEYVNYTWTCSPGVASNVSIWLQKPDNTAVNYNSGSGGNTRTLGFSTSNLSPGLHTLKACFDTACSMVNAYQMFTVGVITATTTNTTTTQTTDTNTTTTSSGSGGTSSSTPSTPSNLNYSTVSSSSIPLYWTDTSNNEDKFNIQRKLTTASDWTGAWSIQITTANTTTYTDTSVTVGNTYDYRIQACLSGTGCSEWNYRIGVIVPTITTTSSETINSDINNGVTNTTTTQTTDTNTNIISVPIIPTNLMLNGAPAPEYISIRWIDNSTNEEGFKIERKLSSATAFTFLRQVNRNNTTYTDSTVIPGMSYDYRIQACLSGVGCSSFSTLTRITVPSSGTNTTTTQTQNTISPTPFAPSNLSRNSISGTSISLKWTDNADNEDKFNIERKLTTASFWSGARFIQIATANTTNYTDTSVTTGTAYDYRIQACLSGTGCSGWAYLTGASTSNTSQTTTVGDDVIANDKSNYTTDATKLGNNIFDTITNIITPTTTNTTIPNITITNDTKIPPVFSITIPPTNIQTTDTTITTTDFSSKVEDLGRIFEERKMTIENTRERLINTINEKIADIIKNAETSGRKIDIDKINALREKLLQKIGSGLLRDTTLTPKEISNLKTDIDRGINDVKITLNKDTAVPPIAEITLKDVTNTLNTLSEVVSNQTETINQQGGDLLYKDSNKDGISDYDSIHVYFMNPTSSSPISNYEGKNVNAAEKILLGFDPTQPELVKVEKEQPVESVAPIVPTYKVQEVALTETKEVVLKGQALPNSFITLYIYSTPIIVTIKTDERGEWQYVLDKELENGDHTVYTATVNNSGNIIAKSPGYLFTKTAEAVSFKDVPIVEASTNTNEPELLDSNNLYAIIITVAMAIIMILILVGITSKGGNT